MLVEDATYTGVTLEKWDS